jgi:hydroxypyruvate reductase
MNKVSALTADDLVIALVSGGGSALLPCPAGNLTLEDETAVNLTLLGSDVPIAAMNAVRKHISAIKGGRLAAKAYPARVVTLLVSDIPGNNQALVASGPTIPDDTTRFDALEVVRSYNLPVSDRVLAHLNSTAADAPLTMDPRFARNEVHTLASASVSLKAAAAAVEKFGVEPVILSDCLQGEAREVGFRHAAIAKEASLQRGESEKPLLVLSGGETTVTTRPPGRGGRNSEFLLAFAIAIDGLDGINALAADTDGIDGLEDNAGAFADGSSVSRMRLAGLDARHMLDSNDSWTAFNSVRDLFIPGPTGTNVNDLSAILLG